MRQAFGLLMILLGFLAPVFRAKFFEALPDPVMRVLWFGFVCVGVGSFMLAPSIAVQWRETVATRQSAVLTSLAVAVVAGAAWGFLIWPNIPEVGVADRDELVGAAWMRSDVPDIGVQEEMRTDLRQFVTRTVEPLYGAAGELAHEIYSTRLGNQAQDPTDLAGVTAGLLRYYAQVDFEQEYGRLSSAVRNEAISYRVLRLITRSFFREYGRFVQWIQHAAHVTGLDASKNASYERWMKADAELLRDFNAVTSKRGMDVFRSELGDRPFR